VPGIKFAGQRSRTGTLSLTRSRGGLVSAHSLIGVVDDAMTEDQLSDAGQAFSDARDEANAEPMFARAAQMGSVGPRSGTTRAMLCTGWGG